VPLKALHELNRINEPKTMNKSVVVLLFLFLLAGCKSRTKSDSFQPELHFKLKKSALKAPSDLLFYDGQYHLFFQYAADSAKTKIHWGQASSGDLIHWKRLPLRVHGDSNSNIGEGSVVMDWNNTSGLGNENPPMITIYPSHDEKESGLDDKSLAIAYSTDKGSTWEIDSGKSIHLEHCIYPPHDPKIFWHEETQRWIMAVLTGYEIRFYSSSDLLNWEYENVFGESIYVKKGEWTHLDFFPLQVKNANETKWALLISGDTGSPNDGSGTQYFVGDFDGYTFKTPWDKPRWLDNGSDNFAGVVLSDYAESDQPAYYLGWITNSRYNNPNEFVKGPNTYTLPRNLSLYKEANDYAVVSKPIKAVETLQENSKQIKGTEFSGELKFTQKMDFPMEINLTFDMNNRLYLDQAEVFGVELTSHAGDVLSIGYHSKRRYVFIREMKDGESREEAWNDFQFAPYIVTQPELNLRVFIDHYSVELFANDGMASLTRKYFVSKKWSKIALFTQDGKITLKEGRISELKSIW